MHIVLCFTHPIALSNNAQGNQENKCKQRCLHGYLSNVESCERKSEILKLRMIG